MTCAVYWLGTVDFERACGLQVERLQQRQQGAVADTLLLLEHPPTITLGRSGSMASVLVPPARLRAEGIAFYPADRGGDATYHGPGQLVGYPIVGLRERRWSLHRYVDGLEEVLIRTLGSFGIEAGRDQGHTGVWAGGEAIAAIGLGVKRGVAMHGFALNVDPRLEHFAFIRPCGSPDIKATSMARFLGSGLSLAAVAEALVAHFASVFGVRTEWSKDELIVP